MLKLTLRHLWRHRNFTLLNILGLSIGISAAWITYQYASYELSYDRPQPNADRIYRVVSRFMFDKEESGNAGMPKPMADAAAQVSGVEMAIPVFSGYWNKSVQVGLPGEKGPRFEEVKHIVQTRNNYFQLVPYQWLAGNRLDALSAPDQVVLTRSRAAQYFPGAAPGEIIGRTLVYDDTLNMHIAGVVEDLPYPSSFIGQEFRPIPNKPWEERYWSGVNSSDQLYLLLSPHSDPAQVLSRLNAISAEHSNEAFKKWGFKRWHALQTLAEVHFDADYGDNGRLGNKKALWALIGMSLFLLLLAGINYINLATAQAPRRAREIGVLKTLGGKRSSILARFLSETALITLFSVLLSGGFVFAFFRYYRDLLPEEVLKYANYGVTALFLAGLTLVISLLAGLYPGLLVTRFQPAQVLRGKGVLNDSRQGGVTLRKGLIVFQFTIAQLFIAGAIMIGQQLQFLLHQDLGFNRDAVVLLEAPWKLMELPAYKDKHFTLAEELRQLPGVAQIAFGNPLFDNSYSSNNYTWHNEKGEETTTQVYRKYADTATINLYKVPLLAGRNLAPSDTVREYVLNETAVKAFGFGSNAAAIGQYLRESNGGKVPVVGVVADFHVGSFEEKIVPVAFMTDKSNLSTLNIKLAGKRPADWQPTLKAIEAKWQSFYPGEPFKCPFYDENIAQTYEDETRLARIINLATGVAVLISCMGLFGLAAFMAQRRTKEIGIRKVLGATAFSVVRLLSKEFVLLVLIAFVLSMPFVYYFVQQWLEGYAYRIVLHWWMFGATGLAALTVAFCTVGFQSLKTALANPVTSLQSE